jgi:hypothetical protein
MTYHNKTKPKFSKGDNVRCFEKEYLGKVISIASIYDVIANQFVWGYQISWEEDEPEIIMDYVPERYLEKVQ